MNNNNNNNYNNNDNNNNNNHYDNNKWIEMHFLNFVPECHEMKILVFLNVNSLKLIKNFNLKKSLNDAKP